ncbi:putative lipid II flippase FtsW [Fonticella tunisiensis]|uniref:Probable peptidoglycan glycosyltransferase FtsW n=1 Tax=Fonticella tunisiensis TaxID=1096341 RepID=A0A4V3EUZ1_9CLOT|nr:putative lipid II flippase FtsW [Fonticella tunisiensis]TDT61859.1 cell division protein FtsW [Fonticella tunisiensis]
MNKKRGPVDFPLFITILILLAIGINMVFSASMVEDYYKHNNTMYHLIRQLVWSGFGLFAMIVMANVDYFKLKNKKLIFFGMAATIVLLVVVLFMPPLNGARRWIGVGGLGIQPSEIAKLMLIIYLSDNISRKGEKIKSFTYGVLPVLFISGIFAALIILEPNMSTTMIILATAFALLFAGGVPLKYLTGLLMVGLLGAVVLIAIAPYRLQRVTAFLNPWSDPLGDGYQAIQSLYALGSGGFFGVKLGQSRQKFHYIPEAQNDFIFAIIGEELGFIGVLIIILLFAFLIWRGMKIALSCKDKFGSLLATGITTLIAVQSSINFLVVSSFMPVTGVTLPLISYGGSSLVFTMASLGVLLNISRHTIRNGVE